MEEEEQKKPRGDNFYKILIMEIFAVSICIGSQVTDIIYIHDTWDSFFTNQLKIASVAFVVLNAIPSMIVSYLILSRIKTYYRIKRIKWFGSLLLFLFLAIFLPIAWVLLWSRLGIIFRYNYKKVKNEI